MVEIDAALTALTPLPTSLQLHEGTTLTPPGYLNDPDCQAVLSELLEALKLAYGKERNCRPAV